MVQNRIEWISVLQGYSMLLVVIGHVMLSNVFNDPNYPVAAYIERSIYSFHMPLFMFISGMLFYHTKIVRGKSWAEVTRDKLRRLGIPYIFFTVCAFVLKLLFNPLMNRPASLSLDYILESIVSPSLGPLLEMWFVLTLFILFMLYPLYKIALQRHIIAIILGVVAIVLYFSHIETRFLCLDKVSEMLIYFYAGILCFKYHTIISRMQSLRMSVIITLLFIATLIFPVPACLTAFAGIAFSLMLSQHLARFMPTLFSSFRLYTFQIFLMGIFFQMGIRYIYGYLNNEWYFIPCYIASILLGLYIPVLIAKTIERVPNKWLRYCFGLNA